MAGENCIADNLIALYMPNQGTKCTALTSHFLRYPLLLFSFPLDPLGFFLLLCHHLCSRLLCLLSSLFSPAPPLPSLNSPIQEKDLLADPDPTHKGG